MRLPPLVLGLLLATSAWHVPDVPAQEADTGQAAAPARAEDLIRQLRRIEVQQRLDAARAGVEADAAADMAEQGMSPEEAGRQVAEGLGVDVLDVGLAEIYGQQVYAVRAMNPPGNFNDAFMVSVVLVDPRSGEILGQAPASMGLSHSLSPGSDRLPNESLEIRRRMYR